MLDRVLHNHLEISTVSKHMSKRIQNDLLDCMYQIYISFLKQKVTEANYVAVIADETTDVSCKSQFSIVLRYIEESVIVERFVCFKDVTDRTAKGLASALNLILNQFPNAHYIHCYAHQLNLVVRQCCKEIVPIKTFFANVARFSVFFSASPKRYDYLREVASIGLPKPVQTRWNFQSRVVSSVFENKDNLLKVFQKIENESFDDLSLSGASNLSALLENQTFLFFLKFFHELMPHIDILYATFQNRQTKNLTVQKMLDAFEKAVISIRNNLVTEPAEL